MQPKSAHMPQLLLLPVEIQEAILAQVDSRASLASLARVCRHLQPLAERLLYQSVYLRNGGGETFAHAIDRAPERATHVRELLVHYHYVDVPDEEDYYPLYAESLAPTIERLVNLKSLVVKGLEYDAPRDDDDDILGGYERVIEEAKKWDHLFMQSAVSGSRILPSLTKCVLVMDDLDRSRELWDFDLRANVMIHPHLRDLTIVGASISSLLSLVTSPRSTALENLVLECCCVSPEGIRDIFSTPRGLKHFTLKGAPWTDKPSYFPGDRQTYIDVVSVQADSLATLDMDFPPGLASNPALDFRALQHLQELTVDPVALRGDGDLDPRDKLDLLRSPDLKCQLPPSIQRLVFFEYYEGKVPDLHTLLLVYNWISQGSLPNLRSITIRSGRSSADTILNRVFGDIGGRTFYEAFQTVGVELRVESALLSTKAGYQLFDCSSCGVCWRIPGFTSFPTW
ncbi:hypothetical protein BO70DRAFT_363534 [Aspergillus heteromorphus CBS 117.55]|uniref:F-box domain-containing protein n=1 Tax=Aspergillus heteromorphus CBS 117.55 TaxID=1448321 RepID=A0A317VVR7_9EURO|nr:uncharacterized protein BO70DRAFT_363534 [Aspergillus heteromorphus CBS 117.55]PWY76978.1 hypothetical protein BO70DRAFT_363534 [Aspergillus heteromorphus CBS 117.55]